MQLAINVICMAAILGTGCLLSDTRIGSGAAAPRRKRLRRRNSPPVYRRVQGSILYLALMKRPDLRFRDFARSRRRGKTRGGQADSSLLWHATLMGRL